MAFLASDWRWAGRWGKYINVKTGERISRADYDRLALEQQTKDEQAKFEAAKEGGTTVTNEFNPDDWHHAGRLASYINSKTGERVSKAEYAARLQQFTIQQEIAQKRPDLAEAAPEPVIESLPKLAPPTPPQPPAQPSGPLEATPVVEPVEEQRTFDYREWNKAGRQASYINSVTGERLSIGDFENQKNRQLIRENITAAPPPPPAPEPSPPEQPPSQPNPGTLGSQPPESSDGEDITDPTGGVRTIPEVGRDQPNNPVVGRTPGSEQDVEDVIEDVNEADATREGNETFTGGLPGDMPDDLVGDNINDRPRPPWVDKLLRSRLRIAAYELGKYRQANWLAGDKEGLQAAIRPVSSITRPRSNAYRGFALSRSGRALSYIPTSPFNTLPSIRG